MDITNSLVILKHGEPFTNSLLVAKKFHKQHKHIIEKIRFLSAEISAQYSAKKSAQYSAKNLAQSISEDYNPKFIESSYKDASGKSNLMYYLNQDAFAEVVGNLNGKEARQWKREYHAAFNKMAKIIVNKQNQEWLEKRERNKIGNKEMTDAFLPVVKLAESQGSSNGNKIYMNIQRLQNKTLGIKAGQRDRLEIWQMNALDTLQFIAKTIAAGLVAQGADWHQVYKDVKAAYENYSRMAYIERRLQMQILPA